jgi:hypothetical protein
MKSRIVGLAPKLLSVDFNATSLIKSMMPKEDLLHLLKLS